MIGFSRYQTQVKKISEKLIMQIMRYLDACSDPLWSSSAQPHSCLLSANPVPVTLSSRTAPGQRYSLGQLRCIADEEEAGSGTSRAHLLQSPEPLWPAGWGGLDTHPSAPLHRMLAALAGHSSSFGAAGAEPDIHILTRWNSNWWVQGHWGKEWNGWFHVLSLLYLNSFSHKNGTMFCNILDHREQMK